MDRKVLWLFLVVLGSVTSTKPQTKAAIKSSDGQKSASTDYKSISGPDDKGNNYIPFQWQVEIVKREYDDYVLPDGTVYRVPHGAVPPHRYKGPGPYNVPYYVFKEDKGHSGKIYGNRPKLVETFDTQTLELLLQDWYQEELWSRGYLGNDRRYPPASQEYYGDYDSGGSSAYAPSENHEKTYGNNAPPPSKYRSNSVAPNYFMRSFNGTQRWSDPDYSSASSRVSSRVSANNGGFSPHISQSEIGRPSSSGSVGENAAFSYISAPSAARFHANNYNPDVIFKANVQSDIRPTVHPFKQLFRGSLTSDDRPENLS